MLKFLHDDDNFDDNDDAKATTIPRIFSEYSRAIKNKMKNKKLFLEHQCLPNGHF